MSLIKTTHLATSFNQTWSKSGHIYTKIKEVQGLRCKCTCISVLHCLLFYLAMLYVHNELVTAAVQIYRALNRLAEDTGFLWARWLRLRLQKLWARWLRLRLQKFWEFPRNLLEYLFGEKSSYFACQVSSFGWPISHKQYVLIGRTSESKVMQHQTIQKFIMCGTASALAIRKSALHGWEKHGKYVRANIFLLMMLDSSS